MLLLQHKNGYTRQIPLRNRELFEFHGHTLHKQNRNACEFVYAEIVRDPGGLRKES